MRWNKQPVAERPEWPKLVAITAANEQANELIPLLLKSDPAATLVNGGKRGLYARVHNEAAEATAKSFGESRTFVLGERRFTA